MTAVNNKLVGVNGRADMFIISEPGKVLKNFNRHDDDKIKLSGLSHNILYVKQENLDADGANEVGVYTDEFGTNRLFTIDADFNITDHDFITNVTLYPVFARVTKVNNELVGVDGRDDLFIISEPGKVLKNFNRHDGDKIKLSGPSHNILYVKQENLDADGANEVGVYTDEARTQANRLFTIDADISITKDDFATSVTITPIFANVHAVNNELVGVDDRADKFIISAKGNVVKNFNQSDGDEIRLGSGLLYGNILSVKRENLDDDDGYEVGVYTDEAATQANRLFIIDADIGISDSDFVTNVTIYGYVTAINNELVGVDGRDDLFIISEPGKVLKNFNQREDDYIELSGVSQDTLYAKRENLDADDGYEVGVYTDEARTQANLLFTIDADITLRAYDFTNAPYGFAVDVI